MDLPPKRPRLSFAELNDDDNEYCDDDQEEEEFNDNNQPNATEYEPDPVDLQEARFHNDQRLKSIFEGIFEKYEKDFTDVGDEIDLQTGSILVNNGHIAMMDGEGDTGERGFWLFDAEAPGSDADGQPEGEGEGEGDDDPADAVEITNASEVDIGGDGGIASEDDEGRQAPRLSYADRSYNLDGQWERPEDEVSEVEDDDDQASVSLHSSLDIQRKGTSGGDPTYPPAAEKENSSAEAPLPANRASSQTTATATTTTAAATDPKWHFPEISRRFWTPPAKKVRPAPTPINAIRSASPPGSGSLWALPGTRRRNTSGTKRKSSTTTSQRKRKRHSSPIICDWSFAKTPDGSESDDPLQEDYEPSPTPRKGIHIRGKRRKAEDIIRGDGQSIGKADSHGEGERDVDTQPQPQSPETPHPLHTASKNPALDSQPNEPPNNDKIHNSADTGEDSRHSPAIQSPTVQQRRKITPDEAKLLVTMRQNQRKRWKEIRSYIPDKKEVLLSKWFGSHWTDRQMNPLPLSAPWSRAEQAKLDSLKDQPGLTWDAIRASIPGRPFAEVEFELLRCWVGEDGMDGTRK